MKTASELVSNFGANRSIESAVSGDADLGLLRYLPGTWQNSERFMNRGWKMIALPFSVQDGTTGDDLRDYRVLANQ